MKSRPRVRKIARAIATVLSGSPDHDDNMVRGVAGQTQNAGAGMVPLEERAIGRRRSE